VPAGGYLKAVRVAQNRSDVVRVVLDVAKVKDYSVFELAGPDRLVVDVYGPAGSAAAATSSASKANPKPPAAAAASANSVPAVSAPAVSGSAAAAPAASTPKTLRVEAPRAPSSPRAPSLGLLPLSAKVSASLLPMPALPKTFVAATVPPPESLKTLADNIGPAPAAKPTRGGERSLTRALGLKIGRIVID